MPRTCTRLSRSTHTLAAVTVALLLTATHAHVANADEPEPFGQQSASSVRYIVELARGHSADAVGREYGGRGARLRHVYRGAAFNGFAGSLSPALVAELGNDKRVVRIEQDAVGIVSETQTSAPWNLDRVDQRALPLNRSYSYLGTGVGTAAYVLDSGVRATHREFAGRMSSGYDATGGGSTEDCNGHGTHVAGTVAGTKYGAAKGATVVPVRVAQCNGAVYWSDLILGLDWIASHHQAGTPAVANASLYGPASDAVDDAVRNLIADGVVVTVAAGNTSADACSYSPGRVAEALTVAATSKDDSHASFSNHGACVDLYAPGVDITSASGGSDNGGAKMSGTSMAAPLVAGAAAVYAAAHPESTSGDVAASLVAGATQGVITGVDTSTHNLLLATSDLRSGSEAGPVATTPLVEGITLTGSVVKNRGRRYADLAWTGISTASVDVYRNGAHLLNTTDTGTLHDLLPAPGAYLYTVCEAGSAVACSPSATVEG